MEKRILLLVLFSSLLAFQNCGKIGRTSDYGSSDGSDFVGGVSSDPADDPTDDPNVDPIISSTNVDNDPTDPPEPTGETPIPTNCEPGSANDYGPYPKGSTSFQVKKCLSYATVEERRYEKYVLNRVRYLDMEGVERQIAHVECKGTHVGAKKYQRTCAESRWCAPDQDTRPGLDGNPMPCRTLDSSALIRVRP